MSTPNMQNFIQQFELIYKKFADWAIQQGFKPNRTAFARHVGVSQGCMQKWEKGQRPTASHMKLIHDKLGFAYDWLITGEGEMFDCAAQMLAEKDAEIERLQDENRKLKERPAHGSGNEEKAMPDIGKAAGQE